MKNLFIIIMIIFCWSLNNIQADPDTLPVGTRSAGMMNAYTTVADDTEAILLNPAGLSQMESMQVSLASYSWHDMFISHTILSAAGPLPASLGSIGLLWQGRNYSRELGFHDREDWTVMAYSRRISSLLLGMNFQYKWTTTDSELVRLSEKSTSVDLGAMYLFPKWKVGFAARNIWSHNLSGIILNKEEPAYCLGLAYLLLLNSSINAECSLQGDSIQTRIGNEWQIGNYFQLRFGLNDQLQYSFGTGIIVDGFNFSYAYQSGYNDLLATHFTALSYKFNINFNGQDKR